LAVLWLLVALSASCGGSGERRDRAPEKRTPGDDVSPSHQVAPTEVETTAASADAAGLAKRPSSASLIISARPVPSRAFPGSAPDPSNPPEKQARCLKDAIAYAHVEDDLTSCLVDAGYESDQEVRVEMGVEVELASVRTWGEAPPALRSCVQNVLDGVREKLHAYCYATQALLVLHWNARGSRGSPGPDGFRHR